MTGPVELAAEWEAAEERYDANRRALRRRVLLATMRELAGRSLARCVLRVDRAEASLSAAIEEGIEARHELSDAVEILEAILREEARGHEAATYLLREVA